MKRGHTAPELKAALEGMSWARREWRATVGRKRGPWAGTFNEALAIVASPTAIAVSLETAELADVLYAAASDEWTRLRREARI